MTNGQAEETNTLLCASFQDSPITGSVTTPEVNQTGSTVTPDEPAVELEEEEDKPTSQSSQLNPDATPFVVPPTANDPDPIKSASTGNESDDEKEIDESPIVTTGRQIDATTIDRHTFITVQIHRNGHVCRSRMT